MKKCKILYICLGIMILIDGALGKYILERKPVCERTHWSDVDRTKEIVPDEETARRIAEASFKREKSSWGYHEGLDYQVEVIYDEPSNEWIVTYTAVTSEGHPYLDGVRIFGIRRDNGYVFCYVKRSEIGCHDDF